MTTKQGVTLLLTLSLLAHPSTSSAQGLGWRWFQSCDDPTTIVLDVRLDTAQVFRTTFPICFLRDGPWSRQTVTFRFKPTKGMVWPQASMWRGGARVHATTTAGSSLVGELWEQGTDTAGSVLGIVIKRKDTLTVTDTIFKLASHKASPTERVVTELGAGLVLSSYPLGWQPRPVTVRPRSRDNKPPPTPWIAVGECPGEGCSFGAWVACSTVVATKDKRRDAQAAFTLQRGDRFTALSGDVHVETPGVVVFRDTVTFLPEVGGPALDTVAVRTTDTLYLLNELGEGLLVWWLNGRADTGQIFWGDNPFRELDPNEPAQRSWSAAPSPYGWCAFATGRVRKAGSSIHTPGWRPEPPRTRSRAASVERAA